MTQNLQIIFIILIFALTGVMEKVKHCWETTYFSGITKPFWLKRYLNPHERLFNPKSRLMQFMFNYFLAGANDFWHTLKFIWVELIIIGYWVSFHETGFWTWLVLCNAIYFTVFELCFTAILNKK